MATDSSVLAWRIPGMGEPGGLLPMGSRRVGQDWCDLAAAAAASYRAHTTPAELSCKRMWISRGRNHEGIINSICYTHESVFLSVQFNSHSVVSTSLWPHELQHARPPYPSPTPGVYTISCQLSQWCHPTISSSVDPFSSCLQSFPASGSFPMSQLFASGGQNIGVSASISLPPMNTQDWFPLGWTGWISSQSKGYSRVFSSTTVQKHQFFCAQLSL